MEDYWKAFEDKRVGILGMGYIGSRLYKIFEENQEKYNISLVVINRENIGLLSTLSFDYFFNCAGNTGDFRNNFHETIDSNINLILNLLDNLNVKKSLVHLSSTRIYGFTEEKDLSFSEDYNKADNHLSVDYIYDGAKKLTESVLWNNRHKKEYKIIICRLSNLFGRYYPRDLNDSTFIKLMIKNKLHNIPLIVNHNHKSTKGYIFIDDALDGIIRSAIFSEESEIYNICSGESYSVEDWINFLDINNTEFKGNSLINYSKIDITKARTQLNFNPEYNLSNLDISLLVNT
jgi:nucleoside-diphosphate-sugar epimerase